MWSLPALAGEAQSPFKRPVLYSPELSHRLFDRLVLLDEWQHAVLGVVKSLGLLENFFRFRARHYRHSIFVGRDNVAAIHPHSRARHRDVDTGETVVID